MNIGWICPKCNAGVAPTCARCPCVDIAKRFVHPAPWYDKGPVTYPDPDAVQFTSGLGMTGTLRRDGCVTAPTTEQVGQSTAQDRTAVFDSQDVDSLL